MFQIILSISPCAFSEFIHNIKSLQRGKYISSSKYILKEIIYLFAKLLVNVRTRCLVHL